MRCNSKSIHTTLTPAMFWESVNILITKPHVINKRLWGIKIWFRHICKPNLPTWKLPTSYTKLDKEVTVENVEEQAMRISNEVDITICSNGDKSDDWDSIEVILMELLPKTYTNNKGFQLVCLHKAKLSVNFYNVSPEGYEEHLFPDFPYGLQLQDSVITLTASCDDTSKSYLWLQNTLLPQFIKWGTESDSNNKGNVICNESLALVCNDEYYEKYNYLKLKYGKEMVKIWPECTDPSKFVYEDVAIAAYLLLLWEDAGTATKQTFVDLGCGNGLLVYILTQEGHHGLGLDVRKRQIWDVYPNNIKLEEKTIIPSDVSIFPKTDWIIGNHSDELTPWIPVIAARSSYKCNFFLLPCCAYNFDGTKYQRKNSFKSQYNDYLEHIKWLCKECGFNVATDRLKIPSTKRICLVGRGRTYSEGEQSQYCSKIQELINKDSGNTQENQPWVKDFKARDAIEKVRNCTQLDKNLIESIVNSISKYLLEGCSTESDWSIGKTVEFNELVQLIPQDELKQLKSECGGLQTLLKNNHNIFKVQNGKVQLRYPKTIEEVSKNNKNKKPSASNIKVQQKPCWFYSNHPQGCPLNDMDCSFLHVKG